MLRAPSPLPADDPTDRTRPTERSRGARALAGAVTAATVLVAGAAPAAAVVPGAGTAPAPALVTTATSVAPQPLAPGQVRAAATSADAVAAARLRSRVEAALAASGATTVAAAVDVEGLGAVVRRDAEHPLPPASTQKSYTAVAALLALGAGGRLRTEVATTAAPVRGRLVGSLHLVGGGDPYLTTAGLRSLARAVRAAGVTSVTGGVVLDDARYDARRTADGWKRSYLPGQSGPLSSLAVDRNRWRRDAAFLADPALPAAARFRDLLRAEGVAVAGPVVRGRRPAAARTLASRPSGPVSAVVARVVKDSDNFAAELLLKEVGHVTGRGGSSAGGAAGVRALLAPLGVAVGATADGSGLSSRNRQSPAGQVALLRAAEATAAGAAFRAALPVACWDGTLRRRMCGTPAAGRLAAKTGTLAGVRTLAGYTRTASGRPVWFAFQLTGVRDGNRAVAAMDRAAAVLAGAGE